MPQRREILLLAVLFLVALFTRLYRFHNYTFGFDQVQLIENGIKIAGGDIALIGPRTGPAPMFTGPLIYYITAVFVAVFNSPWAIVPTALSLSLATGVGLWLMAKKYAPDLRFYLVALWALSPMIITLDRVAWNPNLSLLAGVFSLFPLLSVLKKKHSTWFDAAVIGLGVFLGYQAHFSGLLLPALVVALLLVYKKFDLKVLFFTVGASMATLLPTLLFDLKNNWLNVRGFFSLLSEDDKVNPIFFVNSFGQTLISALQIWGRVLFQWTNPTTMLVGGVALVCLLAFILWKNKGEPHRHTLIISSIWALLFVAALSVYRQDKPEYYFLVMIPGVMLLTSVIGKTLLQSSLARVSVFAFGILYVFANTVSQHSKIESLGIGNVMAASNEIHIMGRTGKISSINLNVLTQDRFGLDYLLKNVELSQASDSAQLQVDYPQAPVSVAAKQYGDLSFWIDPRSNTNANYLTHPDYLIETPASVRLLQSHYASPATDGGDTYIVFENGQLQGQFVVIIEAVDELSYKNTFKTLDVKNFATWIHRETTLDEWVYVDEYKIYRFFPNQPFTQTPQWLDSIYVR